MVAQGEQPVERTTKEITREIEEVLMRAARLEAVMIGKRHNDQQDNSRLFGDGAGEGARSPRHHTNYNQRHPGGREWLRDRSRSVREELGQI
jgi:hypothetical protein